MKLLFLIIAFSLLLFCTTENNESNQTTEEDSNGSSLYFTMGCNNCHGIYGDGIGNAPKLNNKTAKTLNRRLHELQKGKTHRSSGAVMISFAQSLNDDDIEKLSNYISTLKEKPKEVYEDDDSGAYEF